MSRKRGKIKVMLKGYCPRRIFRLKTVELTSENSALTRGFQPLSFLIVLLVFAPGPLSAATRPRNLSFGIYAGWSPGLGGDFARRGGGGWHEGYDIALSLGAYIQYNISPEFSVQANGNYQPGRKDWGILTYEENELVYLEGMDRFHFVSLNVNGVFNESRWKAGVFYLLAGGGMTFGDWHEFSGIYFNLTAGAGIKITLSASRPGLALNLGLAVVHLIDPNEYDDLTTDYFRFQAGMEF
jgi:hypothetical protein